MERYNIQYSKSWLLLAHPVSRDQLQSEGLPRMPNVCWKEETETFTPETCKDRNPFSIMGARLHRGDSSKF